MTLTQKQLIELIKFALGGECDKSILTSLDIQALFGAAQGQTVLGLAMDGLEKLSLPLSNRDDRQILFSWVGTREMIYQQNTLHRKTLKTIHELLKSNGIQEVYMKGVTVALRYPQPLHRTVGDIDFVVAKDDFKRTLEALEKIAKVDYDLVHEHHGMAHIGDITIEPHYKVHNYQYEANDKAMQEIFDDVFPNKLRYVDIDDEQVPMFPPTMESVFLISHMVNHVYEEGLGLRQVIDYRQLLENDSDKIDWTLHTEYLQRMHMTRAFRVFTRICEKYLGLSTSICKLQYTSSEVRFADKMIEDIMNVGNFGRNAYIFDHSSKWGEAKNYLWVLNRCIRLGALCRTEAMSWPMAKAKRYFWKKSVTKSNGNEQ